MDAQDRVDWQRFLGGDRAAFGRLYHRHKDSLLTYCIYKGLGRESGEDILQEAFARLAGQVDDILSVRNWLFICVRNLSLNRIKRDKLELALPVQMSDGVAANPDTAAFIERVLRRLEPEDRELILLRELHGFSTKELAAMNSMSDEAIRVRLYRIRKRMHELGKVCI